MATNTNGQNCTTSTEDVDVKILFNYRNQINKPVFKERDLFIKIILRRF